jgi:diguanylate cyclase (GGDEF)-like protein
MNLTLVLTAIALISYFYTVSGNTYQNVLFEKSNNDPLTKLYNRRYVDGVFEYKMLADKENEAAYGLLLIDVDFFKKVNDVYGHRHGDHVLVTLAGILKQHVRKTSIVSRWGGEEFLIVLDNSNKDDLLSTAERLRTAVERTVMHEEPPIQITITLGGAVSRDDETFQTTLTRADEALYRGKQAGRNQVSIA